MLSACGMQAVRSPEPLPSRGASADTVEYGDLVTPAAKALGLRPLSEVSLPSAGREVRVWIIGMAIHSLLRIAEQNGRVQGEAAKFWRSESFGPIDKPEPEWVARFRRDQVQSGCRPIRRVGGVEACKGASLSGVDWRRVLLQLDSLGISTLADPQTLARDDPFLGMSADGWSMVVEIRTGNQYRTYSYDNPYWAPWPEARVAEEIAKIVNAALAEALPNASSPEV